MNRNPLLSTLDHFLTFSSLENGLYDGRFWNLLLSRFRSFYVGNFNHGVCRIAE
jgi:hypothetical protein